ncbi:CRIM domain-containing protein [Mycena sanguinolenta]|uniref:CRIM domain-containing protein n=1 Tax=Mycena sanguinolenta TaxID=230812 RepID=A0A8H6YEE6_9AGAR|nr:CRIM domain-containing protein [Mycena sanguinolenta]
MFSRRRPRSPSGATRMNDSDEIDTQSGEISTTLESISSGGWPSFSSTLIDGGWTVVPSSASRSVTAAPRRSYRHSAPVSFSFEVPEDPLRAAIGLETVLEQPNSRHGTGTENVMAYSLLDFSRRQVPSIEPHSSALSAMVTSHHSSNPFACVAPLAGGPSTIEVYFPHAEQPYGKLLELTLPATATVEDAIALALWTYWDKFWLPQLEASRKDTDISSWIMLVPGKDGEINKRIAQTKIANFNFDKYAIVRSPRSRHEKQKIENQISKFKQHVVSSSRTTTNNKRHMRHHSLPVLQSGSKRHDAPVSLSKLPCQDSSTT